MAKGELGRRLRELRGSISQEQLADRVGWTQSKVSKIETGRTVPSPGDVEMWARAVGASEALVAELVGQAESAATEATSWRVLTRRGLHRTQLDLQRLEAAAAHIRTFQPWAVPGLLQHQDYARRVLTKANPARQDVTEALAARMHRQAVLYDRSKRFEFVVAEAALWWRPGPPSVLVAQLGHLAWVIQQLPNVRIGVIPLRAEGADAYVNDFVIYEGEESVVTAETFTAELSVREPRDVAEYLDLFERFSETAVFGEEVQELLRSIAEDVRRLDP